jgi:hypothetical protein
MEAIRSSETSVLIRATRRHLPEDDNHHLHFNTLLSEGAQEAWKTLTKKQKAKVVPVFI